MAHRLAGRESFESITLGTNAQIESNVCDRGDSHHELAPRLRRPAPQYFAARSHGPGRLQVYGLMQRTPQRRLTRRAKPY
jgi:hypothetical protein